MRPGCPRVPRMRPACAQGTPRMRPGCPRVPPGCAQGGPGCPSMCPGCPGCAQDEPRVRPGCPGCVQGAPTMRPRCPRVRLKKLRIGFPLCLSLLPSPAGCPGYAQDAPSMRPGMRPGCPGCAQPAVTGRPTPSCAVQFSQRRFGVRRVRTSFCYSARRSCQNLVLYSQVVVS